MVFQTLKLTRTKKNKGNNELAIANYQKKPRQGTNRCLKKGYKLEAARRLAIA